MRNLFKILPSGYNLCILLLLLLPTTNPYLGPETCFENSKKQTLILDLKHVLRTVRPLSNATLLPSLIPQQALSLWSM